MTQEAIDEQKQEDEPLSVKINFRIPVGSRSVFAHHLFVQEDEMEVTLAFFEIINPIIPGDRKDQFIKMIQEAGINAECVARIKVPKNRFPGFVDAMSQIAEQVKNQFDTGVKDANNQSNDKENS